MLRIALLTVLALVASSSATILPVALREFAAADIKGVYTLKIDISRDRCPKSFQHSGTYDETTETVPHTDISVQDEVCNEGTLNVLSDSAAIVGAVESFDAEAKKEATQLLADAEEGVVDPVYAIDFNGRVCGTRGIGKLGANTFFIFLKNSEDRVKFGSIFLPKKRVMVVYDPAKPSGACYYTAALRSDTPASPAPASVTPSTASASPSPDAAPASPSASMAAASASPMAPTASADPSAAVPASPTPTPSASSTSEGTGEGAGASPDPEESEEEDDGVCFPADATVELEDGSIKKMDQVELGDRLLVADGVYSDVFMFSHKDAASVHRFVKMTTVDGRSVSATAGHYLYINDRLAAAASAKAGDMLQSSDGSNIAIEKVESVRKAGLYNPQTLHGDIVVDSIRASTFTRTVELGTAQALLAPLRMLYSSLGMSATFLDKGANTIASYLPKGHAEL